MNDNAFVIFATLIPSLPQVVIAIVGIVLALTRLRTTHPRAWSQVQDRVAYATKLGIANLAGYVLLVLTFGFLLAAILSDREGRASKT